MKKFDIPEFYKSPIISKVKAKRKLEDPRKKNFSPSSIKINNLEFIISRHFGFCYGVENAIEKSYQAIEENPNRKIYLLSQMIHNPEVNEDLISRGLQFIQDTNGNQLISWDVINADDIVIIPAFGATLETIEVLKSKGIDTITYNTTCPFVEKVWNRSASLGDTSHTVIIHGKSQHEETKATYSHSKEKAPSMIIKNMDEAYKIKEYLFGKITDKEFLSFFKGRYSKNFDPKKDLNKIGVVNQTTMLASETTEITEFLKEMMIQQFGSDQLKNHFADTRDTLCYATNDNQTATHELLKTEADLAIVVGGYNSSNTTHLVELLQTKFITFFIKNETEIMNKSTIRSFDIEKKELVHHTSFLPNKENVKIILTSGASCPDIVLDRVMQKISTIFNPNFKKEDIQL